MNISQFLYSAKLGDGCFYRRSPKHNYLFQFTSYNKEYIDFAFKHLKELGYFPNKVREMKSGYKEGSSGHYFQTRVHKDFTYVANLSIKETIERLNLEGLIFLYLDDGSFHKNKHTGHLYCNTFSEEEASALIDKFYAFYSVKKCTLHWDKKRSGKKYPYIYIPVSVMNLFKHDIKELISKNSLNSFMYKVGLPSQTTEKQ